MLKITRILSAVMLICAMAANFAGCTASGTSLDLMKGIKASSVSERNADETFALSQMELTLKLLKASAKNGGNTFLSPLSIQLALAMTANGAVGQTREEMEVLLGGQLPLETLNQYLNSYVEGLPSDDKCRLNMANSIWFRDDGQLVVEESFLQTNAEYYGAQIKSAPFNGQTVKDINEWVQEQTDGTIDKILDTIDNDTVMYLINAMAFDAQWKKPYQESDVFDGTFVSGEGKKRDIELMRSTESVYLEDGLATGFLKNYEGDYSFAALLPNEGISLEDYVSQLTAEDLMQTLENAQSGVVLASLPKFSYEYALKMNGVLAQLGMPTAFDCDKADFNAMGHVPGKNIYIGEVLHKTYISVDTQGTKAGAATKVHMNAYGAIMSQWTVTLDRPFLYMILDNATNLPIFIGTASDIGS